MELLERAIETTAVIDAERRLVLDGLLPVKGPTKVRVIILLPEEVEESEESWLRAASMNPAFDFLRDQEEDIYTRRDGRVFNDKG